MVRTVLIALFLLCSKGSFCQLRKLHYINKQIAAMYAKQLIAQADTGYLHAPNGTISGISLDTAYFDGSSLMKFSRLKLYKNSKGENRSMREVYYYLDHGLYKIVEQYFDTSGTRTDVYYLKDKRIVKSNTSYTALEQNDFIYLLDSWKRLVHLGQKNKFL